MLYDIAMDAVNKNKIYTKEAIDKMSDSEYQKHKKDGGRPERTCLTKIKARRKVILLHIIMVCENGEKVLQMLIFQCFLCLKQVKSTVQKRRGYQLDSQGLDIHKLCTCFPTEVFHN